MNVTAGARLGPYEIQSALGAGGMGEVYQARDTKLGRDVELKILPGTFAHDPERIARFQREAQVLAALNHPNIAHIHGLEESDGVRAIAMELVEGPTLADRIGHGPIPLAEALPIARQIADALEAAHEQGIVHRDLKPANIILKGAWGPTPTRWKTAASSVDSPPRVSDEIEVKVLDFGLAKALAPAASASEAAMNSPTLTAQHTQAGIILGTAAYRSPEQAKGRAVYKRADGIGDMQRLTDSKNVQLPGSWHPSGKFLAFCENSPQTGFDLMMLPMEGDEASGWKPGKPTVFLNGPANEQEPMFSPDGRWLAYESNESGRYEVYVRPFPASGGKWQISTGGGRTATWSHAKHELFYETPDQRIMAASYFVDADSFRADKPRLWSDARFQARSRNRSFGLHPDDERFALAAVPESQAATKQDKIVFVFNFFDELRRIAPRGK